jgi:hypothetical protein
MIRNLPSQALPKGAVLDSGNFNVTTNGLKARGGFSPLIQPPEIVSPLINEQFNYVLGDVQNTFLFQQNDGQTELLTSTNEALYKVKKDDDIYERISFGGTLDAVTIATINTTEIEITQLIGGAPPEGTAYVDMGNSITEPLRLGDYIRFGTEYGIIQEISFDATYYRIRITVDNVLLWNGEGPVTLDSELNFKVGDQYKLDHAQVNGIDTNSIVFTANRGLSLAVYDQTGILTPYLMDSTSSVDVQFDIIITKAKVSRWYKNRLWIANTTEDGGVHRQRVRWSDATTYLNLDSAKRFRPENYVDLNDSMGEVLAIYPMGEQLIVYCSDAIYYGRASHYNNLPYIFNKINTPNIGLVGQSAVTPWIDGHYFVGQDDIYFLNAASSMQPIGSTILSLTLDVCFNKAGIDVRPDPANDRIVFLFPEDTGFSDITARNAAAKLYTFNYKTGAWSYLEASYDDTPTGKDYKYYFGSISSSMLYSGHTDWADEIALEPRDIYDVPQPAITYNWDRWKITTSTWDSLKDGQLSDHTFLFGLVFRDPTLPEVLTTDLYVELNNSGADVLGYQGIISPVRKIFVSADYDFDIPDDNKQVNRFSIKLEKHVIDNTLFTAWVSNDRGYTYKPIDQIMILSGKDEGKVNFRSKGSTFRFKIESDNLKINTVNEFVIRLSKRGKEI